MARQPCHELQGEERRRCQAEEERRKRRRRRRSRQTPAKPPVGVREPRQRVPIELAGVARVNRQPPDIRRTIADIEAMLRDHRMTAADAERKLRPLVQDIEGLTARQKELILAAIALGGAIMIGAAYDRAMRQSGIGIGVPGISYR